MTHRISAYPNKGVETVGKGGRVETQPPAEIKSIYMSTFICGHLYVDIIMYRLVRDIARCRKCWRDLLKVKLVT